MAGKRTKAIVAVEDPTNTAKECIELALKHLTYRKRFNKPVYVLTLREAFQHEHAELKNSGAPVLVKDIT